LSAVADFSSSHANAASLLPASTRHSPEPTIQQSGMNVRRLVKSSYPKSLARLVRAGYPGRHSRHLVPPTRHRQPCRRTPRKPAPGTSGNTSSGFTRTDCTVDFRIAYRTASTHTVLRRAPFR
jgi:hypothetical protein